MQARQYYSVRTGAQGAQYDLPMLRRLFLATYKDFEGRDYFQKMLGKYCVDNRDPPVGTAGSDVQAYLLMKTRKDNIWPIDEQIDRLTEDDVFDLIELLFDHVAKGVDGYEHAYANCGVHYSTFDDAAGQRAWRSAVNQYIRDYSEGFELSERGEILRLGTPEFRQLLAAPLPGAEPTNVEARVSTAVLKFRQRSSTPADRRDAVRDLADVLEYLRPQIKRVLDAKDEADLFNLANNFGIRHHNVNQKTGYDPEIWLNWMFYFYLATIHTVQRLLKRREKR